MIWSVVKILAALLLVLFNAFFVAAEFSLVKIRKTRLAELAESGSKRANIALKVAENLNEYLSACQLGITLASLGLGWLGEPAIATLLRPIFQNINGWDEVLTHTISTAIAFSIITFLHIVLGELIPKSLTIQKVEALALSTAGPLHVFYKSFYPLIWALNGIANWFLKLGGINPANEADLAHSEEELRMLVDASQKQGYLDKVEGKLLDNVFEFTDRVVSEVMVPRQDMVCLYIQNTFEEVIEVVKQYGHTRYPLCDDDKDNVIGLVHMRDLITFKDRPHIKDLTQIKREVLMVPEGMPISNLVQKMRAQRTHLAIVVDEFGGTAGMVTIEDLVEELVGEIYDEFENEKSDIAKVNENEYLFDGRVLLDEVSEILGIDLTEETVSTIGGYVFNRLGRKPLKGDRIEYDDYIFQVVDVVGLRITKVRSILKEAEECISTLDLPEEDKRVIS